MGLWNDFIPGESVWYTCPDDLEIYHAEIVDPEVPVDQLPPGVRIRLDSGQERVTDPNSVRHDR